MATALPLGAWLCCQTPPLPATPSLPQPASLPFGSSACKYRLCSDNPPLLLPCDLLRKSFAGHLHALPLPCAAMNTIGMACTTVFLLPTWLAGQALQALGTPCSMVGPGAHSPVPGAECACSTPGVMTPAQERYAQLYREWYEGMQVRSATAHVRAQACDRRF